MTAGSHAATATTSAFADVSYHTDPGLRTRPPTRRQGAISVQPGDAGVAANLW